MIINIENEKGLNANLSFEPVWNPVLSLFVKKYCDHLNDYTMMDKLQKFKDYLHQFGFLKNSIFREHDNALDLYHTNMYKFETTNQEFISKVLNMYRDTYSSYLRIDENKITSEPDFNKNEPIYGFITFKNFIGATSTVDFNYISKGDWEGIGFEAMEKLVASKEATKLYIELMDFITNIPDLIKKALKSYSKMASKKGNLIISEYDPLSRLVSSTAYLIYNPTSNGYLNYKGNYVPMSGARLFESAVEAERTSKARGITNDVVIVESKISLTCITNQIPLPSSGIGELGQGIADLERKTILENLNKVTMEDLLNQIEILKSKVKEDNAVETEEIPEEPVVSTSNKRRRM